MIGSGLYTTAEAARFLRARPALVTRWAFGEAGVKGVFTPTRVEADRTLSFVDLIQLRSIRSLRLQYGLPLARIRQAVATAERECGIESPLAHRYRFAVFDGVIVIEIGETIVGLTGRDKHQRFMSRVVTPFLDDLRFDRRSRLAVEWVPMESKSHRIVLDPTRRFGQPIVMPGAVLAEPLAQAVVSEGSVKDAAEAFDVDEDAVKLAWTYMDSISDIAA